MSGGFIDEVSSIGVKFVAHGTNQFVKNIQKITNTNNKLSIQLNKTIASLNKLNKALSGSGTKNQIGSAVKNHINNLNKMKNSTDKLTKSVKNLNKSTQKTFTSMQKKSKTTAVAMQKDVKATSSAFKRLIGTMSGMYAAGTAYSGVEHHQSMRNRLNVFFQDPNKVEETMMQLKEIAKKTNASWVEITNLYARTSMAVDGMGYSKEQILKFTENIAKIVRISGATRTESENSVRQLTQGLGSGTLRGDEFRSVREQLTLFSKLMADYMGVTMGELTKAAEKGALKTQLLFDGVLWAEPQIEKAMKSIEKQVSHSLTNLQTEFISFIGTINDMTKSSKILAGAIDLLADNLDSIGVGIGTGIGIWVFNKITKLLGPVMGLLKKGVKLAARAPKFWMKVVAIGRSLVTALGAVTLALGRFAGIPGLIITAVMTSYELYKIFKKAEERRLKALEQRDKFVSGIQGQNEKSWHERFLKRYKDPMKKPFYKGHAKDTGSFVYAPKKDMVTEPFQKDYAKNIGSFIYGQKKKIIPIDVLPPAPPKRNYNAPMRDKVEKKETPLFLAKKETRLDKQEPANFFSSMKQRMNDMKSAGAVLGDMIFEAGRGIDMISDKFVDFIVKGEITLSNFFEKIGSIVKGVISNIAAEFAKIMFKNAMTSLLSGIFGAFSPGAPAFGSVFGSMANNIGKNVGSGFQTYLDYQGGYANGGSFRVGGSGGTDSQLVGFRATPGERVDITPQGKRTKDSGGIKIVNVIDPNDVLNALNTSTGEKVILNVIERNPEVISRLLGSV